MLASAWEKWGRAKSHLETLNREAVGSITFTNEWLHRYPAVPETHRNGLEYRFYVEPEAIDTTPWTLLIGDCLFNLRAALDHTVYELHRRRFRDNIPKDAETDSSFPILTKRPTGGSGGRSPDTAKWKEIKRLSIKQRRAIEFLQPYNRRKDTYRRIRIALANIHELNIIDKHRHLHVLETTAVIAPVGKYAGDWGDDPGPFGFEQESFLSRPLVGKTEVFRWTFNTVPPDITQELNKDHHITAVIGLYEDNEFWPMRSLLTELVETVQTVLTRFEVFVR
jgi:hypothetical protein